MKPTAEVSRPLGRRAVNLGLEFKLQTQGPGAATGGRPLEAPGGLWVNPPAQAVVPRGPRSVQVDQLEALRCFGGSMWSGTTGEVFKRRKQ